MGPLFLIAFVGIIFWLIVRAAIKGSRAAGGAYTAQAAGGVSARGLVLTASQIATNVTSGGRRYERRQLTLDVEIPGQAPYIVTDTFLLPRGVVEGTPGSSLELSVNPRNPASVTILGPGGFTGPWLQNGPPRAY